MAKDDSNGGFLSKVVKFVRHPTTSWSDLDTRSADRESEYSKAALKEMIERKRRNDFVRKREFDMLRKIRSREASGAEGPGVRPSFFQSSLPSKPDDRAMTLKKIDEIEAQMSMQWWKTKGPDSSATGSSSLSSGGNAVGSARQELAGHPTSKAAPDPEDLRKRQQYKETEPAHLATGNAGLDPVVAGSPPAKQPAAPVVPPPEAAIHSRDSEPMAQEKLGPPSSSSARTGLMAPAKSNSGSGASQAFSASHFFALDVQEIVQDPEVEEAAIRFANGDDTGAEQGLLEVLGEGGARVEQQEDWLALFDLYRATGQMAPFESQAVDFVNRFSRSAPQWFDMPDMVSKLSGKKYTPSANSGRAAWVCDAEVDAHAVGTLQNVLLRVQQPWVLDWSQIEAMDVKAAKALLGVFTLWGDQEVELRFLGASNLRDLLKDLTPSGRRDVEQLWWELRLAVLRVMNRADEFELTALDFCVTYEVSPPGWEQPRCHYRSVNQKVDESGQSVLGEVQMEQVASGYPGDSVQDSQNSEFNQLGLVELSGEIRGDPQATLEALERRLKGADVMIISCRNLIRVDFSAAGTLLNWVSGHHAEGRAVQFVDAHRLVSAFFHVIGITEYAKVVLRND
ncbi:anti-anti-sigma regulatory factor [Hydrogenophaga palleronii]|uniref:Anti-anti-sigma regulatory factor n=1 Tax=Hydrogenophaga palleronii TaxID=65655 RepID=A0ABU1WLS8_9BURK|nr:STAS domain-containing protein [Hydrogenophaga palleronii]MDR7150188.1 anti-anti-sigma regulatory factor [Hydrogenophaga palleronii]